MGAVEAKAGDEALISVYGLVTCEITGFSMAIGHDPSVLTFRQAFPGAFLLGYAGSDLAFEGFGGADPAYSVIYALFDISFPVTIPPVTLERDTLLATISYSVSPFAPSGPTPLRNASLTFGDPIPVSNIYTRTQGLAPFEPRLIDGRVDVLALEQRLFLRGDSNGDSRMDIADPVWTLGYLFQGTRPSRCRDAADTNDDGREDISDAIFSLSYLFVGGLAPPPPGPLVPGPDPTADALTCE